MKQLNPQAATLIFPCAPDSCHKFYSEARERGENVVIASSVVSDLHDERYQTCSHHLLPYIYEKEFETLFLELIRQHNISQIFCPIPSVHVFVSQLIAKEKLNLRHLTHMPIRVYQDNFLDLQQKASSAIAHINNISPGPTKLTHSDVTAILQYVNSTYGESSFDKICSIMGIFHDMPQGDIVEIGVLAGKTAGLLALMNRYYKTGAILAIDPWTRDEALQAEFPSSVRDVMMDEWDFDLLATSFVINMLPIICQSFNYLRMCSEDAFTHFCSTPYVSSQEFGTVEYKQRIAMIHIDGNHDYEKVKLDCDLWLTKLAPGAWLVLDDYLWPHGDGPNRVGHELLTNQAKYIEQSFVSGGALFIKFC